MSKLKWLLPPARETKIVTSIVIETQSSRRRLKILVLQVCFELQASSRVKSAINDSYTLQPILHNVKMFPYRKITSSHKRCRYYCINSASVFFGYMTRSFCVSQTKSISNFTTLKACKDFIRSQSFLSNTFNKLSATTLKHLLQTSSILIIQEV